MDSPKSSKEQSGGPDGLPNEFAHIYWDQIKEELIQIVQLLHLEEINLKEVNRANIIMIPKHETAEELKDYRPISIINLIPKIISKILATRLSKVLPDLVSMEQMAFIKGRQISENFVATREILQHTSYANKQAVFLKLDFTRAFDTLN